MTERRQFIGYDSSAECDQFIGYDREIIIDNERKAIRVFGGDKVGGYETARADLENVTKATLDTKLEPTIETLVPPIIDREIADEVAELNGRIDSANVDIGVNELEIENLSATKADKATSLNGYGIADAYTKSEVDVLISQSASSGITGKASNYIEVIPDNIKLELANSALILKNGSKAYKFDGTTVNITKDLSISATGSNGQKLVFTDGNGLAVFLISMCASSDTNPGAGYQIWYNNSEKKIYADNTAQGNFRLYDVAAPIGIVTCQGGKVVSIDQVFNGFGFIGSHWYYLEGTAGRDMNGRNTDGSLKGDYHEATNLGVFQAGAGTGKYYLFTDLRGSVRNSNDYVTFWQDDKPATTTGNNGVWISQRDNFIRFTNDAGATWNSASWIYCGWYEVADGKITKFEMKQPIKLADEQDVALLNGNNKFTGNNTYEGQLYSKRAVADSSIIQQNLNDISGAAPSTSQLRSFRVLDKNGKILGDCRHTHVVTTGESAMEILARNTKSDGSEVSGSIRVRVLADGTVLTAIPTPSTSATGAEAINAAWFNTKIKVVSTLPASPDPNVYYFIPE